MNTQVMVHEFVNSFCSSVAITKWFLNYFPSYFIKLLIKAFHIILHLFLNITMFKNSLWTFVSCSQRFVNLTENSFAKYFTYIAISTWCVKLKFQTYIFPRSLLLHVATYIFYVVNSFYQAYTVYTLQYISTNENVQISFKLVACGWHCWILVLYVWIYSVDYSAL